MLRSVLPWLVALAILTAMPARARVDLAVEKPTTVADCDALVAGNPRDLQAYRCYVVVAQRFGQWIPAVERLEAHLQLDDDNQHARFYLARIEAARYRERSEALFRESARGFARQGNLRGEIYARVSLVKLLSYFLRYDEVAEQHDRIRILADESGETDLRFRARLQEAQTTLRTGDQALGRSLLRQLDSEPVPQDYPELSAEIASELGMAAWGVGDLETALGYFERGVATYRQLGDEYLGASASYNAALLSAKLGRPGFRHRMQAAVELARRSGNLGAEASSLLLVAQDREIELEERIETIERVLTLARSTGHHGNGLFALRLLAGHLMTQDPVGNRNRSLELLAEAAALAERIGSTQDRIRAVVVRAYQFEDRPREEVLADYEQALGWIEQLRDLQRDELVRARLLWHWAFVYYRYAGFLLGPLEVDPAAEDAALAFRVIERLRARILLDALDQAGATSATTPDGEEARLRRDVLDRISAVQRRLLSPGLAEEERQSALSELERLEAREVELRARMGEWDRSYALLRRPAIPSVSQLQSALDQDEALITFHLSTRRTDTPGELLYWKGGSWAFLVTRDHLQAVPLPDEDQVEETVSMFIGLLQRRDEDLERDAASRLYDDLLRGALEDLPERVDRLVLIPHGALHHLPFAALRSRPGAPTLAATHEISLAPSATLWYHWRTSERETGAYALALADPSLQAATGDASAERSALFTEEVPLGPLPYARKEARSLVRFVGGRSDLRTGADASESFLKSVDLSRFGILHFAAHAVVDDRQPQRSAVVLAPGAPEEDGLLQLREVVQLDLDGALVILSACSSISGEVTEGDGVVGLARAFFHAGARTVVGSLWPLQDAEAAQLIGDLSRHLGHGLSVGSALAAARRDRIAAGAPTAAWAGLVVLGDADLVPLPGGSSAGPLATSWPWLLALALAGLLALWLRRRTRA